MLLALFLCMNVSFTLSGWTTAEKRSVSPQTIDRRECRIMVLSSVRCGITNNGFNDVVFVIVLTMSIYCRGASFYP
jgi:hypothetical protein